MKSKTLNLYNHLHIPLRDIIASFLCTPFRFLSSFVPKDENIYVFGSWMGKMFSDNPRFFYDFLQKKHPKIQLHVVMSDKKIVNSLRKKGYNAHQKYSLLGLWYALRAKFIFVTHSINADINIITTSKSNTIIHFWHGSPGKKLTKLGYLNSVQNSFLTNFYNVLSKYSALFSAQVSAVIVASEFGKEKLAEFLKIDLKKIHILGYPRNDILFREPDIPEKVFLYLPTYRKKDSENSPLLQDLSTLNKILIKTKSILVIKPHPAVKKNLDIHNYSNIKLFSSYFPGESAASGMAQATVLITDYSGLLYDFALTGRPIIFFCYDYDQYSQHPGLAVDYLNELPGPFVYTNEELYSCIEQTDSWSKKKKYRKKYKEFSQNFNTYHDDKSSQRLYRFLQKHQ